MPKVTSKTFCDSGIKFFSIVEVCDKYESGERGIKHTDSEVLNMILAVPGVQVVHANGYEITLYRSLAYEWDEIVPQVTAILTELAGATLGR
jgi:hypothetical protein